MTHKITIYRLGSQEEGEYCHPVDDVDWDYLTDFFAHRRAASEWKPIRVHLLKHGDRGERATPVDAPWIAVHLLILKPRARLVMERFLLDYGAWKLHVECSSATNIAMFSPARVRGYLDEENSTIERFDDGRILSIDKHVFMRTPPPAAFFAIDELRVGSMFVSQEFVDLWTRHGLTGLTFTPIWSTTLTEAESA